MYKKILQFLLVPLLSSTLGLAQNKLELNFTLDTMYSVSSSTRFEYEMLDAIEVNGNFSAILNDDKSPVKLCLNPTNQTLSIAEANTIFLLVCDCYRTAKVKKLDFIQVNNNYYEVIELDYPTKKLVLQKKRRNIDVSKIKLKYFNAIPNENNKILDISNLKMKTLKSALSSDAINYIYFWRINCEGCKQSVNILKNVPKKYKGNLNLIGINTEDSIEEIKRYVTTNDLDWKVFKADEEMAKLLLVNGYPYGVIIKDKKILKYGLLPFDLQTYINKSEVLK